MKFRTVFAIAAGLAIGVTANHFVQTADAAPVQADQGMATYGAVNVGLTPTLVPGTTFGSRNGFGIRNWGPNTIYCGFDGGVTTDNGWPVDPKEIFAVDVQYDTRLLRPRVYCVAETAAQVSPRNTRNIEVH